MNFIKCKSPALHDGQQDDDDKEEEGDVVQHPCILQLIPVGRLQLVPDATPSSNARVEVVDEAGEHVVALAVGLCALLLLHIEFAEKVEGNNGVQVHNHQGHHLNNEKM